MATIDKINSELLLLQQDLSKLKHYTAEIGKAKDASVSVITMADQFIASFQKKIEDITVEMTSASVSFKENCEVSSKATASASSSFKKGIGDAQSLLYDVAANLSVVAEKVNGLAESIDSINIKDHFQRIHDTFHKLQSGMEEKINGLNYEVKKADEFYRKQVKKVLIKQFYFGGIVLLIFFFNVLLVLKVFKVI